MTTPIDNGFARVNKESIIREYTNPAALTGQDIAYDLTSTINEKIDSNNVSIESGLAIHEARIDNPHSVTQSQVGLSNVDNTSDLNKPVSLATQSALNDKVDKSITVNGKSLSSNITINQDEVLDGSTYKQYSQTEKTKLASIETGAEVNNMSDVNVSDLTDGGNTSLHIHDTIYLSKTNTDVYAPSANYHPATKKYADDLAFSSGGGNMYKSTYDTNNDGKVDTSNDVSNSPIITRTSVASQGGLLINIDSAVGDIARTTDGFVENEKYGIYYSASSATSTIKFSSTTVKTGRLTIQLDCSVNAASFPQFRNTGTGVGPAATWSVGAMTKYGIPIKPSTKYRIFLPIETVNTGGVGAYLAYIGYSTTGNRFTNVQNNIPGTFNGIKVYEFTSNANDAYLLWALGYTSGCTGTMNIDYNNFRIEEVVEPIANSLTSSSPSLVSFTAVGSTDNIDITNANGGGNYTGGWCQKFTAVKSKLTSIVLKKGVTNTTTDWTYEIRTDNADTPVGGTVLASNTKTVASFNAVYNNTEYTTNLPCNLTPGQSYWICWYGGDGDHTIDTSGLYTGGYVAGFDGTTKTAWFGNARDAYFKTLYYKPTTNFKASQNNSVVSIPADEDGFQYGSVLNLSTGTYSFATPYSLVTGSTALLNQILCYSQTGLMTQSSPTDINWRFAHTIVFKVKIPLYSSGRIANLIFGTLYNSTGQTVTYSYSYDYSTWYTAQIDTTAGLVSYLPGGLSIPITNNSPDGILYIRYQNSGGDNRLYWVGMNTTVDTSSLSTLRNYPTNKDIIKQYSTTLGSPSTSATYRATKWGFPAIEYSATEYQFLDVDTTATGSTVYFSPDGTTYTLVADGGSIALTSTSNPLVYVRSNITANRIYLSSNNYNASGDKDGSNKMEVVYQVKSQGLIHDVEELKSEDEIITERLNELAIENTGDNATNTTSNTYADGKVAQTITNGVTTSAPSQDVVFDALALKAPLASPTFTGTVAGITAAMVGAPSGSGICSNTNTGDQTSIVGITGTIAQFNSACTDADFVTGGGTASGSNTGDQTSIVGITGTKAQFDTSCTDGNFMYSGDTATTTNALQSATTTVNVSSATAPTSGQVLTATSSTTATWQTLSSSGVQTIGMSTTNVTMVKTDTVENTIFTQSITGGLLSTTKAIRVRIAGNWVCSAAGSPVVNMRVKYGTTNFAVLSITSNTTTEDYGFEIEAIIKNSTATSQSGLGNFTSSRNLLTLGGSNQAAKYQTASVAGTENTANTLDLKLTTQLSGTVGAPDVNFRYYTIELL